MLLRSGYTSDYVENTGERRKAIGLIWTYLGYLIVVDYLHVYAARDNNKTGEAWCGSCSGIPVPSLLLRGRMNYIY